MKGLIASYILDGEGGGRALTADELAAWQSSDGVVWAHFDYASTEAREWLETDAGLSVVAREALVAHDPRPRALQLGDGLLIVIRGINENAQSDPEDMVSLRLWIEEHRVISLRHRPVAAVQKLRARIERGVGPVNAAEVLHHLYDLTLVDIATLADRLDADVDTLEDEVLAGDEEDLRHRLALLRRQFITLRRHINPQRVTLTNIPAHKLTWLTDIDRLNLGEAAEKQCRIIEELDSARERASVTNEELQGRLSQLMDQRLYVLSLIAAISLPLGILTGLLGVNVGGIPMQENAYGFLATCGVLVLLSLGLLYLFRRLKWL